MKSRIHGYKIQNNLLQDVDFKWFKLPFNSRIIVAGILYIIAIFLQFAEKNFILGVPFIIAAWVLLGQKIITNKPDDQGFEDWRAVDTATVDRILNSIKNIKTKGKKYSHGIGCSVALVFLLSVITLISIGDNNTRFALVLADGILLFIPSLFTATARFFIPPELDKKFSTVVTILNAQKPEGFVLTPYVRFDRDKQKNDIPEDIRFMLEKKHAPEDFIGVQFQVAINNGPNGEVPYLYAVALTKGKDVTYKKLLEICNRGKFIVEGNVEGEYGIIVIRQQTTGTGYHTTESDCKRLWNFVLSALNDIG